MAESEVEVSPQQRATRRRALGRRMATAATLIDKEVDFIRQSVDRKFLETAEETALSKQLKGFDTLIGNLAKLADRLESK